ncbi:MAG: SPOR domain-containing protein [Bacteroides sp.]
MKTTLLNLFLFVCLFVQAQGNIVRSLEQNVAGQGTVTVHQDSRIQALIGNATTETPGTNRQVIKAVGYRVQVYAGNNSRKAREEAKGVSAQVKEYFPELPVYTHFSSPRWLCRVGDFKSMEEAYATLRQLKGTGVFKEVSIVREQINIPL